MAKRTIRPQERCFCIWYAMLCNVQEAALHAGYSQEEALERGVLLLQRDDCRELIHCVLETLSLRSSAAQVMAGLERLAFGSCNDAVRLVFAADSLSAEELAKLDLFGVSEVKRDKNGGVEVKFCDRQKAMEQILSYSNHAESQSQADALLAALTGANAHAAESI
ncbi:MAG: terminase small subunit [Oscillospiraceae bacterium]|nr:terminase small subunit [Oscillospiraceae bacterium]MDD7294870.1 terminase small subunit [Oscillospiraceae bacterium]MDY2509464.1 terminase small subunit [Ruminococcus callidus]